MELVQDSLLHCKHSSTGHPPQGTNVPPGNMPPNSFHGHPSQAPPGNFPQHAASPHPANANQTQGREF